MTELERLLDTDVRSLDARIGEVLQRAEVDCVVQRFTLWYTGRAPVHGARVLYAASSAA
jgi:hypothetical protein